MLKKYRIVNILHSGRKGTRNTHVTDEKYDGMMDTIIKTKQMNSVNPFERLQWTWIGDNRPYDYWETSPVIGLYLQNNAYYLETVNTIYVLEEIENSKLSELLKEAQIAY